MKKSIESLASSHSFTSLNTFPIILVGKHNDLWVPLRSLQATYRSLQFQIVQIQKVQQVTLILNVYHIFSVHHCNANQIHQLKLYSWNSVGCSSKRINIYQEEIKIKLLLSKEGIKNLRKKSSVTKKKFITETSHEYLKNLKHI